MQETGDFPALCGVIFIAMAFAFVMAGPVCDWIINKIIKILYNI
jgi:hypothetical protein